ncbi:MAG: hypothetical protein ACLR17_12320 [Enterobacteriaceae bacterium]
MQEVLDAYRMTTTRLLLNGGATAGGDDQPEPWRRNGVAVAELYSRRLLEYRPHYGVSGRGYNNSWRGISYSMNYSYNRNTTDQNTGKRNDEDHLFALSISVPLGEWLPKRFMPTTPEQQ